MRSTRDYLDGLVELHRQTDAEERKALWRQSVATLAAAVTNQRQPVPLEGLDPGALQASVQTALSNRLVDDLEWLSAPAAAATLYELAAALPAGREKRELGRRVLQRLHEGDAATFVALATRVALGSQRALSGAPLRARVALALDLPIGAGPHADSLALALISRRDLQREWLRSPSTGSLPARRLAARLLERAAREAARRAGEGDDSGIRVFQTSSVRTAWDRLLADRESLVWRHVATARGLLGASIPELDDSILHNLDASLTPTEWRRAAASLSASIALDPERALTRSRALLDSDILQQDRGVAGAMIFGLPRAVESEPEAVEELLEQLVRAGGLDAAEALVDLRREHVSSEIGMWAAELARSQLHAALESQRSADDGRTALMQSVVDELAPDRGTAMRTLRDELADALAAFAHQGARAAYEASQHVLEQAESQLQTLERCTDGTKDERQRAFRALRDLDLGLCETDRLGNLLMLGASSQSGRNHRSSRPDGGDDEVGAVARPLGDLFDRMTDWLLSREGEPLRAQGAVSHFTLRLRRLRTMLHVVDADGPLVDDRGQLLRERRLRSARALLTRVRDDARTPLKRALCATAARACDALVREELAEVSDVLIAVGTYVDDTQDLEIFAEASMIPDNEAALRAYHELEKVVRDASASGRNVRGALDTLGELANGLPVASSPRVEALRASLQELRRALEALGTARSLSELGGSGDDTALGPVGLACQGLAQLVLGTRRRMSLGADGERPSCGASIRLVDLCLERVLKEGTEDAETSLSEAIDSAAESLRLELPRALADTLVLALQRVRNLPFDAPQTVSTSAAPPAPKEAPLPPWMPPSRTLGGFYVDRALGSGAGGSVFVARRTEERRRPDAPQFALKVPEYDAAAARKLSEDEFMQMFRQEASALLSLPQHRNIARFVTFDAGASPKPILVMELVEGASLERLLETSELDTPRALEILDGIASGLEAMHRAEVGHLDLKPQNVILRSPDQGASQLGEPVLVDFGLAGRHIRPGCATAEYGAPEIWDTQRAQSRDARPPSADVYAFGCMTYEVLTGQTLFDGPHEMAVITDHFTHDGEPSRIEELKRDPQLADLANVLSSALRQDPAARASIASLRRSLRDLEPKLTRRTWPLAAA